jgi:O-antigen ligase
MWLAAWILGFLALGSVRSREAILALAIGTGALVILSGWSGLKVLSVLAALALLLTPIQGAVRNHLLGERITQDQSESDAKRAEVRQLAIDASLAHPFTGLGYGLFANYTSKASPRQLVLTTHNEYLRLSAETGAMGLVLFLALVALGLRQSPGSLDRHRQAVVLTYLIGLLFATTLSNLANTAPFWLLLGTGMGGEIGARRWDRFRTETTDSSLAPFA